MNGGDTDTGGAQVNPSNTPPSNPGSQTMGAIDSSIEDTSLLSISHDQLNPNISQQPVPQPGIQASTPGIPGVVTDSMVSPSATYASSNIALNTAATAAPVPHFTINANPQSQSRSQLADQLISQTFSSGTPSVQSSPNVTTYKTHPPQPIQPDIILSASQQPTAQFSTQTSQFDDNDIVVNALPSKKSKKGLLIGFILVLAFVAIIGLLIVFVFSNNRNNTAKGSFENFVVYLTGENDASKAISDFNANSIYSIDKYYYSNNKEERQSYFGQLGQLWETFIENYEPDEKEELVKEANDYLKVLRLYVDKGIIPGEKILEQFLKDGEDGVRSYFNDYYSSKNIISDLEMHYLFYQDTYLKDILNLIQLYYINGCIAGDEVSEACIKEKSLYDSGEYNQMKKSIQSIHNFVDDTEKQVKITCEELIEKGVY